MLKKWSMIAVKVLVSGGLLWFILKDMDVQDALTRARRVDPVFLIFAALAMCVQVCLGGFRWKAVASAINVTLTLMSSLRLFYIGMFFNQALPGGSGGDAVRMYMAYRSGIPLRGAINSVMLERAVTVIALVLLVDVTQVFFDVGPAAEDAGIIRMAALLISLAAIGGLIFVMILDRLPEGMGKWRFVRGLGYLASDARSVFLNVRNCSESMFWSGLTHINLAFVVYLLAVGLAVEISFLDCLILVPPVALAATVPISIGGWGVREGAMVWAFSLIGVPESSSVVMSILVGLIALGVSLPAGLVWLTSREHGERMVLDQVDEKLAQPRP